MPTRPITGPFANSPSGGVTGVGGGSRPAWVDANGVTPTIALDFANGRYYGGTQSNSLAVIRGAGSALDSTGAAVNFGANEPRITDLGLYYDTTETGADLAGAMLAAIQGAQGTVLIETWQVGVNNSRILGGDSSVALFARGGGASALSSWNGSQNLSIATAAPLDTAVVTAALRFSPSGRTVRTAAPSSGSASDANGIGSRARVRIGRDGSAGTGSGFIRALYFFAADLSDAELAAITSMAVTVRRFAAWGDSMTAGAGASTAGTRWIDALGADYNPDANFYNGGNGGDTSSQVLARFNADAQPLHRRWTNVFWLGHNSPNAAQTVADLRAMVSQLNGEQHYIIVQPVQSTGNAVGSAGYNEILATRSAISAAFPANRIFDAPSALSAANPTDPNVADGYTPSTLLADAIHLNDAGQAVIKNGLRSMLNGLGW